MVLCRFKSQDFHLPWFSQETKVERKCYSHNAVQSSAMESESARIRKQLLEFENGKFRMNERMPRDLGGLRSLAVARKRTPRPNAKRLEDCEKGWKNAFTKGLHSPPPPASPRSPAASKGKWAAPDSSSPTPSASQDGKYMRRWTDHWRSVSDMDANWRGKSSARIESQTQRAMNAKILEAGWVSTF